MHFNIHPTAIAITIIYYKINYFHTRNRIARNHKIRINFTKYTFSRENLKIKKCWIRLVERGGTRRVGVIQADRNRFRIHEAGGGPIMLYISGETLLMACSITTAANRSAPRLSNPPPCDTRANPQELTALARANRARRLPAAILPRLRALINNTSGEEGR